MQDQQTRVYYTDVVGRYIADSVYCFVDTGVCIQVCSELDTFSLTPRHDAQSGFITREVFCSVESHVFKEVSQTALLRLFKDGTHFLCNVKFDAFFWECVVSDVISKPVVKFTYADIFVHGQCLHRLCKHELEVAAYIENCNKKST